VSFCSGPGAGLSPAGRTPGIRCWRSCDRSGQAVEAKAAGRRASRSPKAEIPAATAPGAHRSTPSRSCRTVDRGAEAGSGPYSFEPPRSAEGFQIEQDRTIWALFALQQHRRRYLQPPTCQPRCCGAYNRLAVTNLQASVTRPPAPAIAAAGFFAAASTAGAVRARPPTPDCGRPGAGPASEAARHNGARARDRGAGREGHRGDGQVGYPSSSLTGSPPVRSCYRSCFWPLLLAIFLPAPSSRIVLARPSANAGACRLSIRPAGKGSPRAWRVSSPPCLDRLKAGQASSGRDCGRQGREF